MFIEYFMPTCKVDVKVIDWINTKKPPVRKVTYPLGLRQTQPGALERSSAVSERTASLPVA